MGWNVDQSRSLNLGTFVHFWPAGQVEGPLALWSMYLLPERRMSAQVHSLGYGISHLNGIEYLVKYVGSRALTGKTPAGNINWETEL